MLYPMAPSPSSVHSAHSPPVLSLFPVLRLHDDFNGGGGAPCSFQPDGSAVPTCAPDARKVADVVRARSEPLSMDLAGCPPWIEPSNVFRVNFKVAKYTADVEYGDPVEMDEQEHELWLDRSIGYSLAQFYADVAGKIVWGSSQTLSIWVLDNDTDSGWKIRRDDEWQVMMKNKWDERVAHVAVEVVAKDGHERNNSSVAASKVSIPPRSGVTNLDAPSVGPNAEGTSDTCTSPSPQHVGETVVPCLLSHPPVAMESMNKKAKRSTPPPPGPTAADGDDRLSNLGDDLRVLILRQAHLNVRQLVRTTSVLSTQWRGLWKRFPVLDFFGWPELESVGDVAPYIATVNGVLERRAAEASEARIDEVKIPLLLDAYSLRCRETNRALQRLTAPAMEAVQAWIRYAMLHHVKGLELELRLPPRVINDGDDDDEECSNSSSKLEKPAMDLDLDELLASSPELERMRLGLSHARVQLPRTAVFKSIKDLALESVELAEGSGHLLARLASAACCPRLQKLRLTHIGLVEDASWTKELMLDAGELLELSMKGVSEVVLLRLRTPKLLHLEVIACKDLGLVRASALGLKEITNLRNDAYILGPFPCLWQLKIDLFAHIEEGDRHRVATSRSNICFLNSSSSEVIRCLSVLLYVPPENGPRVNLIEDKIPQLPNVTSLWVRIDVECQRHSFGDNVAGLLTKFKNLEYLSLQLDDWPDICMKWDKYYSEDAETDSSLTCKHHLDRWKSSDISLANLRKAEFRGMTGTGCELRFLRFVLANATDLQSVTVRFNLYFIEEVDTRMSYFLHMLLGDGTWTASDCKYEDDDDDGEYSKLYKWTPSP